MVNERNTILKNYNILDVTERKFDSGITLGYVTPVNF